MFPGATGVRKAVRLGAHLDTLPLFLEHAGKIANDGFANPA
jgi:hypothetical protein